jgi:hypothetical protein
MDKRVEDCEQLGALFDQIEKQCDVGTWQFQDVHFWPIFKHRYFHMFLTSYYNCHKNKVSSLPRLKIYQKFRCIYSFIKTLTALIVFNLQYFIKKYCYAKKINCTQKPVIILVGPGDWLEKIGSEKVDRILDPVAILAKECGFYPIKWESSSWYNTIKVMPYKAKYSINFMQSVIDYLTFIKFPFVLKRMCSQIQQIRKKFNDEVNEKFDLNFSLAHLALTQAMHNCIIIQLLAEEALNKYLFKDNKVNIDIRAVFISGTLMNTLGMSACYLAKKLKIPVIEIQHGEFLFPAYPMKKVPKEGYNICPDSWWIWGEKEYNSLNCNDYHKPIQTGNLWALCWNKGYYEPSIDSNMITNVLPKIIVTLAPLGNTQGLTSILLELIMKFKGSVFWIVRLHPRMNQKVQQELYLEELKEHGIDKNFWVQCSSVMSAAETVKVYSPILHLTFKSSFAREAAVYNIPTVVLGSSEIGKYIFTSDYFHCFNAKDIDMASTYVNKALAGELMVDNSTEYFNIELARGFLHKLKD